jgi:diguanylate cyclase (GGDEF)-like protein
MFSIRARLVLLAVLAVAPLMVDRIRLLEAERSQRLAAGYDQAMGLARRAADAQREQVIAARTVLQIVSRTWSHTWSQTWAIAAPSGETCHQLFSDMTLNVPWLKGVTVVGVDGRIVCSTLPNAAGLNLSDRGYFQEALRTGQFVLSNYLVGRLQKGPTIVAAMPTRGPDQAISGVINAAIDLQWIGRLNGTLKGHPHAIAVLVDADGTLLAGHPETVGPIGQPLNDRALAASLSAYPEGRATTIGPDGVRRMFAFTRLEGTGARVAVGLDEAEILGRLRREMWIAYLQLCVVCGCVLLGIWFGGEQMIIQPIRSLARSAARIGLGNLETHLADKSWAREFVPLAAALDNMARKLGAREDELRCANVHLEELARIDGLSGLANRRGFDLSLETAWQEAMRQHHPLGLLMIDVDHFKLFNDRHGHVEGDECLRAIGGVIGWAAGDASGSAARYGGEEFALLLPGAGIEAAVAVAERLRHAVAALRIINAETPSGYLTISVGVAALDPGPGQSPPDLVAAADAALYGAKRQGRDRVVADLSPSVAPA